MMGVKKINNILCLKDHVSKISAKALESLKHAHFLLVI